MRLDKFCGFDLVVDGYNAGVLTFCPPLRCLSSIKWMLSQCRTGNTSKLVYIDSNISSIDFLAQFVLGRLNQLPKESHDADFSRIKNWYLDGQYVFLWSYRQHVLIFCHPAQHTSVNQSCCRRTRHLKRVRCSIAL